MWCLFSWFGNCGCCTREFGPQQVVPAGDWNYGPTRRAIMVEQQPSPGQNWYSIVTCSFESPEQVAETRTQARAMTGFSMATCELRNCLESSNGWASLAMKQMEINWPQKVMAHQGLQIAMKIKITGHWSQYGWYSSRNWNPLKAGKNQYLLSKTILALFAHGWIQFLAPAGAHCWTAVQSCDPHWNTTDRWWVWTHFTDDAEEVTHSPIMM